MMYRKSVITKLVTSFKVVEEKSEGLTNNTQDGCSMNVNVFFAE